MKYGTEPSQLAGAFLKAWTVPLPSHIGHRNTNCLVKRKRNEDLILLAFYLHTLTNVNCLGGLFKDQKAK